MNYRSDYEIVRVEEDKIFIVDLDLGNKSVTNDAEYVFSELSKHFPGKRIIYRDTLGCWDEICEERGGQAGLLERCGFAPYTGNIPDESEITGCPNSALIRKPQYKLNMMG
jgi:hypothetical protein